MAKMQLTTFIASLILFLYCSTLLTNASRETVCKDTPYPLFCSSILPSNQSASIQDNGRFSVQRSISTTTNLLSLVNSYLQRQSGYPQYTIRALEDCQLLINLNVELLSDILQTIRSANTLSSSKADDIQTFLSATLTNQETCSNGLDSVSSPSTLKSTLQASLTNGTKLHSVSLAIVKHGWAPNTRNGRRLLTVPEYNRKRKLYTIGDNVKVNKTVTVNPDGSGNFKTINAAVAAAPNKTDGSKGYFVIYVVAGVYNEYVILDNNKRYIMMIGDGIGKTIITGNRNVVDGSTTFNSATFIVTGKGFVGVDITFRNTAGAAKHQAVALRSGSDLSTFYRCSFEGYQDTLYTHSLRQFYRECDVYGTVDFIFGNAAVVLQNCNLYPRLPMQGQFNSITAQGRTDINQNTGTSIQNCTIKAAESLGSTKTYLGRPWKEYSRVVYMKSFMDSLIDPAGWSVWSGTFALSTLYYAEYSNTGPGSSTSNRVTWSGYHVINATDAANFTVTNFIAGNTWLPGTGVPFNGGL
ncbi:Pectinesterase [Heracleum sosnowskyi]|uniref:Pectinesterase n=1 Tax=Heracleum sosnowskyi TaxID=360622 RepID=A0AAD8INZ1_9APIA|nr:Pectinesterase [Heracleum sosnowskyi]